MLFQQLLEPESSTYTYLISCPDTGITALIDPVLETVDRDLSLIQKLGLKLDYTIDTHVHADHLTGALRLRELSGSRIAYPAMVEAVCVDIGLQEAEAFRIGNLTLQPLFTPGHTDHHHAYLLDNGTQKMLFSGDALLIDACGRTDFQSGDARSLYRSIHEKFFTLPDETLVYPCHDYEGRFVSTIAQEKTRNPRLGQNKSLEEFVAIMENMDLPYPRNIDFAVPGNEGCGVYPETISEEFHKPLSKHDQG